MSGTTDVETTLTPARSTRAMSSTAASGRRSADAMYETTSGLAASTASRSSVATTPTRPAPQISPTSTPTLPALCRDHPDQLELRALDDRSQRHHPDVARAPLCDLVRHGPGVWRGLSRTTHSLSVTGRARCSGERQRGSGPRRRSEPCCHSLAASVAAPASWWLDPVAQDALDRVGRPWCAEEMTLCAVAAEIGQDAKLLHRLDTFHDDRHIERVAEGDHGADDRPVLAVLRAQVVDERSVELQRSRTGTA